MFNWLAPSERKEEKTIKRYKLFVGYFNIWVIADRIDRSGQLVSFLDLTQLELWLRIFLSEPSFMFPLSIATAPSNNPFSLFGTN